MCSAAAAGSSLAVEFSEQPAAAENAASTPTAAGTASTVASASAAAVAAGGRVASAGRSGTEETSRLHAALVHRRMNHSGWRDKSACLEIDVRVPHAGRCRVRLRDSHASDDSDGYRGQDGLGCF